MVHELFPNKYLFVSECAPNDYRRPSAAQEVVEWFQDLYRRKYMRGGTAFTWMWNWERQYHIIQNKPHIVGAMSSADKPLVEVPTSWEVGEELDVVVPPPPSPYSEGDIDEWLLEELGQHLPPWQHGKVDYNPHTGLARAARGAEPPLGLPFTEELRKTRGSTVIVHQFFWRGACWCPEIDYNDIHIVRY